VRAVASLLVVLAACVDGASSPDDRADLAPDGGAVGGPCEGYPAGARTGEDLLTLVDKAGDHQLAADFVPPALAGIPSAYRMAGRTGELRAEALAAFVALADAAAAERGPALRVRSGYRSFEDQCATMTFYREANGEAYAARYVAPPGRSEHQLGTAVDVTSVDAGWQAWLADNAARFGFALSYPAGHEDETGYAHEPWHYRYVGVAAAAELVAADLILAAYLARCADPAETALACPRS
jgi:D-alanyl-D-alanine carboxypeptidase